MYIKDFGLMMSLQGSELSQLSTVAYIKVNLKMGISMEKVFFNGLMDPFMRVIGGKERYKEEEAIGRSMGEAMKANGKII